MNWNEEARIACHFLFKCPQKWDRLQPTAEEGVRHCHECDRDVHLVLTEEEFRQYSEDDRCITVLVSRERGESRAEEREYVVGMIETPYKSE